MDFKRIVILGITGSGKTTLAHKLSEELGIPHIQLDTLYWGPNWKKNPTEIFRASVEKALEQESWIIDGNGGSARDIIWPKAELAIWLDFPIPVIFYRLLKRTLKNSFTKKELWNGCKESFRMQFFSKNSIFVWAFKSYTRRHKKYPRRFLEYPHLKVIRIRSSKRVSSKSLHRFEEPFFSP